jgi:phosphatidylinositol glycan class V
MVADVATLLFAFSPASVFMSAPYSESLFALLSLCALLALAQGRIWLGSALVTAAAAARSNGLLLAGFVGWAGLVAALHAARRRSVAGVLRECTAAGLRAATALVPLALYQRWGASRWCTEGVAAAGRRLIRGEQAASVAAALGEFPRSYCGQMLPPMYSFIQRHYWCGCWYDDDATDPLLIQGEWHRSRTTNSSSCPTFCWQHPACG